MIRIHDAVLVLPDDFQAISNDHRLGKDFKFGLFFLFIREVRQRVFDNRAILEIGLLSVYRGGYYLNNKHQQAEK
ncbi:MAG: hypothetical protein ACK576_15170 [Cyclobacteriaceae bacterium]